MPLSQVYVGLGEDNLREVLKTVSMGRLRSYQLYERMKTRCHLSKLNTETLRRAAPRLFERLQAGEEDLATELAQAVLICHLDMIIDVLNFLGIPHEEGFFAKDANIGEYLGENWQARVFEAFQTKYPKPLLLFYLNHLGYEVLKLEGVFQPA
jgi:hypothetical protein